MPLRPLRVAAARKQAAWSAGPAALPLPPCRCCQLLLLPPHAAINTCRPASRLAVPLLLFSLFSSAFLPSPPPAEPRGSHHNPAPDIEGCNGAAGITLTTAQRLCRRRFRRCRCRPARTRFKLCRGAAAAGGAHGGAPGCLPSQPVGRRKRFSRCERGLQLWLIWWVMVVRGSYPVAGIGLLGSCAPFVAGSRPFIFHV